MSHEIISLQIGQCGNSIGLKFWQSLSREHGLGPDGQLLGDDLLCGVDNKNAFFHEYESGRFVPRCAMLDLEPRVIQSIKNSEYRRLFEQRNMFVGTEGGGAGNNWASGYALAGLHQDTLCDLIGREAEATDNLEGFLVSHAISGGTGAGMGSFMMELLTESYPKKILQTYSVFPTSVNLSAKDDECPYGDVVIEPYNSLLTLLRLTCHADSVIILDNLALHNLTPESRFPTHPSFDNINKLVANVMTASLAPIRYPGQMFNTLSDVILSLTPVPLLHFLMTGYTPLRSTDYQAPPQQIVRTSVESVLRNLGRLRHMMVSLHHPLSTPHGYISVFNVIQAAGKRRKCRAEACVADGHTVPAAGALPAVGHGRVPHMLLPAFAVCLSARPSVRPRHGQSFSHRIVLQKCPDPVWKAILAQSLHRPDGIPVRVQ